MPRNSLTFTTMAAIVALTASACSSSKSPSPSASAGSSSSAATGATPTKQITVGFSVYDMQYEFFQKMEAGTKAAVTAKGWGYKLHDEKGDENEMVTGAQNLLDQGIDVLIISPFKPDALGPIVQKAKQKNIPVVVDDIGGGGTPYDAIVISDNAAGGKQAADYMAATIAANGSASKKVASITCQPDAVYAARRNEAFAAEIKLKGFQVVSELSGNSKAEEAYKVTKDILAKAPDLAGVFACNDPMGVAAGNAIKDSGKSPTKDIVTVGFNADPEAITAIQKAGLSATIAQDPTGMGAKTVELAAQLLDGQQPAYDNPAQREVFNPVTLVTKDNAAMYAAK